MRDVLLGAVGQTLEARASTCGADEANGDDRVGEEVVQSLVVGVDKLTLHHSSSPRAASASRKSRALRKDVVRCFRFGVWGFVFWFFISFLSLRLLE